MGCESHTWHCEHSCILYQSINIRMAITSTCEIPSVEARENATLTIRFGQDLRQEKIRDFYLDHIGHSPTASQTRLLDCEFSYGNVTCKETSCCTWESHVTDVFRVYIHNVSQELEGSFLGCIIPSELEYQKSCNFSLKGKGQEAFNSSTGIGIAIGIGIVIAIVIVTGIFFIRYKFCGPATTVVDHCVTAPRLDIRTLGEGVSETGERVARLKPFPQQVDILNQSSPLAFLSGPPGTGKTIVLIMQGINWIQRGYDVHVVSTWNDSLAVTFVIEHQLQETAKTPTARSRLHRHQFDFMKYSKVETAVRRLKFLSEGRQLCVIADEVVRDVRKSFMEFCDQLIKEVPGVFIWGASLYHDVRPLQLDEVKLTTPLRSPPVVVREVMEALEIKKSKKVHDYTVSDVPVPTYGPPVRRLEHRGQSGHTEFSPSGCVKCGHEVACVLTELNVGRTGDSNGLLPLQYRDVLVVCVRYPIDDWVDSNGQGTTTANGLVRGLCDSNVPVRVVKRGDKDDIRDAALGVYDMVTVASWNDVAGLERKIVVVENGFGMFVRLHAMSRCTSQLVVIDC